MLPLIVVKKKVIFRFLDQPKFSFLGSCKITLSRLISTLQVRTLLWKSYCGYLAHVKNTNKDVVMWENDPVIKEFLTMFLENLPDCLLIEKMSYVFNWCPVQDQSLRYCIGWHLLNWKSWKRNCKSFWIRVSLDPVFHLRELLFY